MGKNSDYVRELEKFIKNELLPVYNSAVSKPLTINDVVKIAEINSLPKILQPKGNNGRKAA